MESYDFYYRVYLGFKAGWLISQSSTFEDKNGVKVSYYNHDIFPDFKYGVYLILGNGPWNLEFYYNISNLFNKDITDKEKGNINEFRIGWIVFLI